MNDKASIIDQLNSHAPQFIRMLGGRVVDLDSTRHSCTFEFNIGKEFCHSVDIVQGGFVTAMLDAAMSHAVLSADSQIVGVTSLEIKTSFLEPTRAGPLRAQGTVIKNGYKTVFAEGRLYDANGVLTATSSTVAKLVR